VCAFIYSEQLCKTRAETKDMVQFEDEAFKGVAIGRGGIVCCVLEKVSWEIAWIAEARAVMEKQSCNTMCAFCSLWPGWRMALHTPDTGEFWFMNYFKWVHSDLNPCLKSMTKLKKLWVVIHSLCCVCRSEWGRFVLFVLLIINQLIQGGNAMYKHYVLSSFHPRGQSHHVFILARTLL